jgi:hypothetical protein
MSVRIPFNFSSEPFQRNRPVVAASLAAISVLACTLGILCTSGYTDRDGPAARASSGQLTPTEQARPGAGRRRSALTAPDYADELEPTPS